VAGPGGYTPPPHRSARRSQTPVFPRRLKQCAVRPLRSAVDRTGYIGQAHFHGVGRGPLRLFGCGLTQPAAGRAHVPEIAANEIALTRMYSGSTGDSGA
jgi:hypothetical protein